jgi:hypothetical protein
VVPQPVPQPPVQTAFFTSQNRDDTRLLIPDNAIVGRGTGAAGWCDTPPADHQFNRTGGCLQSPAADRSPSLMVFSPNKSIECL